jgi:hypothetical protein
MGYGKSIRAFNRVKGYLDEMVSKNQVITWQVDDPAKTSYNIREGIKVAKERAHDESYPNKDAFKPYASLLAKFIVRVKGVTVVAEPRDIIPEMTASTALHRMVVEDVSDPLEIVGAAIKHKVPELFFPSADLSDEALSRIYAWSSKHDYFIVASDVGVTLTKTDPGEIAWHASS